MKKGGYQIVDLKNINHPLNVGVEHPGIYELIEGTRKPILLSGIQVDGAEHHDFFANPILVGTNFVFELSNNPFYASGYKITVQDDDMVTFNEV